MSERKKKRGAITSSNRFSLSDQVSSVTELRSWPKTLRNLLREKSLLPSRVALTTSF